MVVKIQNSMLISNQVKLKHQLFLGIDFKKHVLKFSFLLAYFLDIPPDQNQCKILDILLPTVTFYTNVHVFKEK
jgi:hypothetical protein